MLDWILVNTNAHQSEPIHDAVKLIIILYIISATVQNVYSVARWVNIFRAIKATKFFTRTPHDGGSIPREKEPVVTIQICSYNEALVIEKTIDAACQVNWPREKLFVQVLDDSTDVESISAAQRAVDRWTRMGINCSRFTRPDRVGYKAGNLLYHYGKVKGDFLAILDADHRCEPNFLRRTVPHFFDTNGKPKYEVGLVQMPWAFYNTHHSLLTEYDALILDSHHVIEQMGRSCELERFGFNGTGGIWRTTAIDAAGGWAYDTVTEDLDLSYASAMAGYRFVYAFDCPQLLEVPGCILSHKQQKHRWTKGFFQVCRKRLGEILGCPHMPRAVRMEAFFHMTIAVASFFTALSLVEAPFVILNYYSIPTVVKAYCLFPLTHIFASAIIACYAKVPGSNGHYSSMWSRTKRLLNIPFIFVFAGGFSIYDSLAMFEGLVSNDATFLRTPKVGTEQRDLSRNKEHMSNEKKDTEKCSEFLWAVFGLVVAFYLMVWPLCYVFTAIGSRPGFSIFILFLLSCLQLPAAGLVVFHGTVLKAMMRARAKPKGYENKKRRLLVPSSARTIGFIALFILSQWLLCQVWVQLPTHIESDRPALEAVSINQQLGSKFLSFDLGGSGLKLLQIDLYPHPTKANATIARPSGQQIKFGYIPSHEDPKKWLLEQVRSYVPDISALWPDFALSVCPNQAYKLWAGADELLATKLLNDAGNLEVGCAQVNNNTSDIASWEREKYGIERKCKKWRRTEDILGFSVKSSFRGSTDDVSTHFEGNTAKFLQGFAEGDNSTKVFSSWGLGTGVALTWTHEFESSSGKAASRPRRIREGLVARSISTEPVDAPYKIKVKIPKKILEKGTTVRGIRMEEEMPFWAIMAGPNWRAEDISHSDLRSIYRSLFKDQVLPAIKRGDLPKPNAMAFSGGVNEHFKIADLLRDHLEEAGILSISGYKDAAHCGQVRLSYPDQEIDCHFQVQQEGSKYPSTVVGETQMYRPHPVSDSMISLPGTSSPKRGVYFLSSDKVLSFTVAFLNSFRHFNPSIPLVLIPYDETDCKSLFKLASRYNFEIFFDKKLFKDIDKLSKAFHGRWAGHYRKLAMWDGPLDEFLYLDIDSLVLDSIDFAFPLLEHADVATSHSTFPTLKQWVWKDSIDGTGILTEDQISFSANTGSILSSKRFGTARSLLSKSFNEAQALKDHMTLITMEQPLLNYLFVTSGKRYSSFVLMQWRNQGRGIKNEYYAGLKTLTVTKDHRIVDDSGQQEYFFMHWPGFKDEPSMPYRKLWEYWRDLDWEGTTISTN